MSLKHFLDLDRFDAKTVRHVLDLGAKLKADKGQSHPLAGKTLALVFEKPSTRTRVSFQVGMQQLGGHAIALGIGNHHALRGGEFDEAAGETGVVRRKRGVDLPGDDGGIISYGRIDLNFRQTRRIVPRRQDQPGVLGMRPQQRARSGAGQQARQRCSDPKRSHRNPGRIHPPPRRHIFDASAQTKEGLFPDNRIMSNLHCRPPYSHSGGGFDIRDPHRCLPDKRTSNPTLH